MECNNKNCMWQAFGECCPESEELLDKGAPGDNCPSFLDMNHEIKIRKEADNGQ